MEEYILSEDIPVVCVVASSFPDGVKGAHKKLHSMIPFATERKYFGISWGKPDGEIHYMAAAEILKPEDSDLKDTTPFTILKGKYMSILINNYMQDLPSIGRAFQELLTLENLDPKGYCVEWYLDMNDVRCMIKVVSSE